MNEFTFVSTRFGGRFSCPPILAFRYGCMHEVVTAIARIRSKSRPMPSTIQSFRNDLPIQQFRIPLIVEWLIAIRRDLAVLEVQLRDRVIATSGSRDQHSVQRNILGFNIVIIAHQPFEFTYGSIDHEHAPRQSI